MVWDEWLPSAIADHAKQLTKWEKDEKTRIRKVASGKATENDKKPKPKPKMQMLAEDADNLLKLSAALKIIMARTIDEAELERAKNLLYDYLVTFLKV